MNTSKSDIIPKLQRMALLRLTERSVIYEEDLLKCDISLKEASTFAKECPLMLMEEKGVFASVFRFGHSSFRDFLAACAKTDDIHASFSRLLIVRQYWTRHCEVMQGKWMSIYVSYLAFSESVACFSPIVSWLNTPRRWSLRELWLSGQWVCSTVWGIWPQCFRTWYQVLPKVWLLTNWGFRTIALASLDPKDHSIWLEEAEIWDGCIHEKWRKCPPRATSHHEINQSHVSFLNWFHPFTFHTCSFCFYHIVLVDTLK